jgi:hypothetical protein
VVDAMTTTATSFESVVAAFDEDDLRCQTEQFLCSRPVKWLATHHAPACGGTQMVCRDLLLNRLHPLLVLRHQFLELLDNFALDSSARVCSLPVQLSGRPSQHALPGLSRVVAAGRV